MNTRKLIRRNSSFTKLRNVPKLVNEWFFSSEELQTGLEKVAARTVQHATVLEILQSAEIPTDIPHLVKDEHELFCEAFENALARFLESAKVSEEQFAATMELAKKEEDTIGEHFYRWDQCLDFDVYLIFLRGHVRGIGGTHAVREHLRAVSTKARSNFRKRVSLYPLLVKWCPDDFGEVVDVLKSTVAEFPLDLDKATKKELAHWKARLLTKVLDDQGVYHFPREEAEWVRYLCRYTENMEEVRFEGFIALMDTLIMSMGKDVEERKDRRAVWQLFSDLDVSKKGKIDAVNLLDCIRAGRVDGEPIVSEKDVKKIEIRLKGVLRVELRNEVVEGAISIDESKALQTSISLRRCERVLLEVFETMKKHHPKVTMSFRQFVIMIHRGIVTH